MRKWTGTTRFSPRPRRNRFVRKTLLELTGSYIENNARVLESRQWDLTGGLDFNNGDNVRLQATDQFEYLARPFRIDRRATIPPGSYDFRNLAFRYTLGAQRRFAGTASVEHGSFYDGLKTAFGLSGGRFNLTNQVQVQPGVSVNRVDLPYGEFTAAQLQARVVYTISPRTFIAALLQYNSSSEILSSNFRLRWRVHTRKRTLLRLHGRTRRDRSGLPRPQQPGGRREVGTARPLLGRLRRRDKQPILPGHGHREIEAVDCHSPLEIARVEVRLSGIAVLESFLTLPDERGDGKGIG